MGTHQNSEQKRDALSAMGLVLLIVILFLADIYDDAEEYIGSKFKKRN